MVIEALARHYSCLRAWLWNEVSSFGHDDLWASNHIWWPLTVSLFVYRSILHKKRQIGTRKSENMIEVIAFHGSRWAATSHHFYYNLFIRSKPKSSPLWSNSWRSVQRLFTKIASHFLHSHSLLRPSLHLPLLPSPLFFLFSFDAKTTIPCASRMDPYACLQWFELCLLCLHMYTYKWSIFQKSLNSQRCLKQYETTLTSGRWPDVTTGLVLLGDDSRFRTRTKL